jgi:hypothetical protein
MKLRRLNLGFIRFGFKVEGRITIKNTLKVNLLQHVGPLHDIWSSKKLKKVRQWRKMKLDEKDEIEENSIQKKAYHCL